MTEYFDSKGSLLAKIDPKKEPDYSQLSKALEDLDYGVVWDVSLCSEFEGFPEDLRARVNQTVLKWSSAAQPVNKSGPDYETVEEHIRGISSMISELHTIFHELAERRLRGFSDDPRTPLRVLYARAEERREGSV